MIVIVSGFKNLNFCWTVFVARLNTMSMLVKKLASILRYLHWLPARERNDIKTSSLVPCSNSSKYVPSFPLRPLSSIKHICTTEENINGRFKTFIVHYIQCQASEGILHTIFPSMITMVSLHRPSKSYSLSTISCLPPNVFGNLATLKYMLSVHEILNSDPSLIRLNASIDRFNER